MDREAMDAQAAAYMDGLYNDEMARQLENMPQPEYPGPPCRSTQAGLGCGHGTMEHSQGTSPNQECCCCTGRANDPAHAQNCRQCQIRRGSTEDTPGAEEIAQAIGTGVAEVGEMLIEMGRVMTEGIRDMSERFDPPRIMLNRAEKRARQGKKTGDRRGTMGSLPNRRRYR